MVHHADCADTAVGLNDHHHHHHRRHHRCEVYLANTAVGLNGDEKDDKEDKEEATGLRWKHHKMDN